MANEKTETKSEPRILDDKAAAAKEFEASLKNCTSLNQKAIKSSVDNEKTVKAALVADILFMIRHGRVEPMNELYKGVTPGDREAIRFFMVGLTKTHGADISNEEGKVTKKLPFSYSERTGFVLRSTKGDNGELFKASKKSIEDSGEAGLQQIGFGRLRVPGDRAGTEFDFNEQLGKLLKRAAREGIPMAKLDRINSELGNEKVDLMTAAQAGKVTTTDLEKAQAKVKKLEAKLAAQTKGETPSTMTH